MKIDLQGEWTLKYQNREFSVQVPGAVEKYLEKRDDPGEYSYYREFSLSPQKGKKYLLRCQGIAYGYHIFINSQSVFQGEGIWVESVVDITRWLQEENSIEIRIIRPSFDTSSPYHFRSLLFGFIPDVLFPFSGIFRPIFIEELHPYFCKDIHVDPQGVGGKVEVTAETSADLIDDYRLRITCYFKGEQIYQYETVDQKSEFYVNDPHLWSPQSPQLYQLRVELLFQKETVQQYSKSFGFREIAIDGHRVTINGVPQYFRAALHWGYYPEEMSVYQDESAIREELNKIRAMGFNAVKFCLFIPEQRYYELCDEMGIMVWQELPLWLPYDNGYLIDRIEKQFPAIVRQTISHPSLLYMSIGCELDSTVPSAIIDQIYKVISDYNTSVIICDNSGGGECFEGNTDTKSDIYDYHFYGEIHHMKRLIQEFSHESRTPKPWLFGEFNDMDTFRDTQSLQRALGTSPFWTSTDFGVNLLRYVHRGFGSDYPVYHFPEIVMDYGYQKLIPHIEEMSLKKAYWVRKYNLETVRTYQSISGYAITALRDVPITATGLIDDFGEMKFSKQSMQMINGDVVISMLPPLRRSWYRGSDIYDSHDVYNFQEGETLNNRIIISSNLVEDLHTTLTVVCRTEGVDLHSVTYPISVQASLSQEYMELAIPLPERGKPTRYELEVNVGKYQNRWDIWTYAKSYNTSFTLYDPSNIFDQIEENFPCDRLTTIPKNLESKVLLTTVYTEAIETLRQSGVNIVYIQQGDGLLPFEYLPFWRENVTILHKNPQFAQLQHLGFDGPNFLSLTTKIGFDAKMLRKIYPNYTPLITRVDNRNFRLHEYAIFIAPQEKTLKKGGNMVITSFDFGAGQGDQARDFSRNYFGKAMLDALLHISREAIDETSKK